MMKFNKRTIACITGTLFIIFGVAACNDGTLEERSNKMVERAASKLELTESQTANLTELKNELLEVRTTIKAQREKTKVDILSMLEQPVLDREQANAIVNSYIEMINTRSPEIIDALGNFYDSLDDAQRAELREFISNIQDRHRHRPF